MAISRELWISNLMDSARAVGDSQRQQLRWLASDAAAWERPAEPLCELLDDNQLELFLKEEGHSLSSTQLSTARALLEEAIKYDVGPDGWRDPEEVLMTPLGRRSVRLHVHSSQHLKSKADENWGPVKSSSQASYRESRFCARLVQRLR
jgi:hypothetical protein